MKPRVGIIGDGNVRSALRRGLERAGYDVRAVGKAPGQVKETGQWAAIGTASTEIVRIANRQRADLVVIGGPRRWTSTTQAVLSRSRVMCSSRTTRGRCGDRQPAERTGGLTRRRDPPDHSMGR
jgi:hypothetical protein